MKRVARSNLNSDNVGQSACAENIYTSGSVATRKFLHVVVNANINMASQPVSPKKASAALFAQFFSFDGNVQKFLYSTIHLAASLTGVAIIPALVWAGHKYRMIPSTQLGNIAWVGSFIWAWVHGNNFCSKAKVYMKWRCRLNVHPLCSC
jgi:hypothetical protein